MQRKFLNARSPLRLLEKGLHGGLGVGNLGLVVAAHGVGKTPFLVGVALDELLRGGRALHVALDQTVAHVRAYYDTVFDELSASAHLEDAARVRLEAERRRSIRTYLAADFTPAKLREAIKIETEAGSAPELVLLEGFDPAQASRADVQELAALAAEIPAELWLSAASDEERVKGLPAGLRDVEDLAAVILALEPGPQVVTLRALKDHDNPDVEALHVALDPRSLLLVRS